MHYYSGGDHKVTYASLMEIPLCLLAVLSNALLIVPLSSGLAGWRSGVRCNWEDLAVPIGFSDYEASICRYRAR